MSNGLKDVIIKELYTLEETIAADVFTDVTYPWEVLPKIGEFIIKFGNTLPEDKSLRQLAEYLNQYMTDEIFVTQIEIMPEGFKNSMSLLRRADYMVVEK